MPPVAVVADTTNYLPSALREAAEIHPVSLYVRWGEELERESDMPDFTAFYERLRSTNEVPSTSQPSIGDFLSVYGPLLEEGRDILSIHLPGGISGTCDSARQAAAELAERGYADRIEVFDASTAAGGMGLVALAAAAKAREGAPLAEVAEHTRAARAELKIWFAVDTLEYLRRGGRIGRAAAYLGGALKIKPILTIEQEVAPIERVRTSGKAFERMVEYLRSRCSDGADGWVVQHIQAEDIAERLVERGREMFGCDPIFVSEIGPVIGTHAGPGLVGVGGLPKRFL